MAAKPVRQFATAWKPRVPSQTRLSLPWNRRFHSTLTDVDQLLLTRAHEIRQSLTYHRLHLQTTELVCSGCAAQGTRIRTGQLGRPFCHLLCFIQVDPLQRRSDRNDLQAPLCTVRGERVNNKAKKKKKKIKKDYWPCLVYRLFWLLDLIAVSYHHEENSLPAASRAYTWNWSWTYGWTF